MADINGNLVFNTNATGEIQNVFVHRITTTERDALSLGLQHKGQIIFNTTDSKFQYWDGTIWQSLTNEEFVTVLNKRKHSVRLATTTPLPAFTAFGSGVGKTLTADVGGVLTVDGVLTSLTNRVLVKDEAPADTDHGIYSVTDIGTNLVAEITSITTVDDASNNLNSTFFLLDSPTTPYYVWYNTGGGIDPAPAGRTSIPVVIATNDLAVTVASATQIAIDALGDFSVPNSGTATIVITNTVTGAVTDAIDGSASTGFTITTTIQGSDGVQWVLTRATDADEDIEVTADLFTYVEEGTQQDTGWILITNNPITVDTTPLQFNQFSIPGFSGSIGSLIDVTLIGPVDGEIIIWSGTKFINKKAQFVFDSSLALGANTVHTVTHNLNQQYCNVTVVNSSNFVLQPLSIEFIDANSLNITLSSTINIKVICMGLTGVGLN